MRKYHAWLQQQISGWVGEGLISGAQAQALRARYPLRHGAGRGRLILSTLGAIIFGLGVLLLFAYNWAEMHKFTKLAVIFAALAGSHAAGLRLRRPGRPPIASEGLHALGTMLFGAAIWLVAQIYHIEEHYPNALLIWGIGALAMAWALPSVTQGVMAVTLVLVWQAVEVFDFSNTPHSTPWIILLGIFPLYRRLRSAVLGGAATTALLLSLTFSTIELDGELAAAVVILTSGAAIGFERLVAGDPAAKLAHTGYAFLIPGYAGYLFMLYLCSFPQLGGELFGLKFIGFQVTAYFATALALALAVWGSVLLTPRFGRDGSRQWQDLLIPLGLLFAVFFSIFGPAGDRWISAAPFNLLLLGHSVLFIVQGSRRMQPRRVLAGCLLLALLAISRYLDLFDSLLARALVFFLVGGVLFMVGNLYARKRKEPKGAIP